MTSVEPAPLPATWRQHREHKTQDALYRALRSRDPADRNTVTAAGRRSGKTAIHLRAIIWQACNPEYHRGVQDYTQVVGLPVFRQAKEVAWLPLRALAPKLLVAKIRESDFTIEWKTGARTIVGGMDRPERFEGFPIDELYLDEYADMKADVRQAHLKPALSTPGRPPGREHIYGTPDGRNHFFDLFELASEMEGWSRYHWPSRDIMDPKEVALLEAELDEVTARQELDASFETMGGRCYYAFDREVHVAELKYDSDRPLDFCFDFNVDPGSCVVMQDQVHSGAFEGVSKRFDAVIDEVNIPTNSRTAWVCDKLVEKWGGHEGDVRIFGDPSGGNRSTTQTHEGAGDWGIVDEILHPVFGDRLQWRIERAHPPQKERVNVTNARLQTADGQVHTLFDKSCRATIRDFESVIWKEGAAFEIEKLGAMAPFTHWTDAFGYRAHYLYGGTTDTVIQERAF